MSSAENFTQSAMQYSGNLWRQIGQSQLSIISEFTAAYIYAINSHFLPDLFP